MSVNIEQDTETTNERLDSIVELINERFDRLEEAIANLSLPGGNYSVERTDYDDE